MKITAHIVVSDAARASEWYQQAFGATERNRVTLPDGRAMTLELAIGESVIHVASEFPAAGIVAPTTLGGTATVLQINTDDARALWQRVVAAGATLRHDLADQFWGELHGQLVDPFGHRWNIAQRLREVSDAELAAAAAAAFGGSK
jgi:PhnB protein